MKIHFSIFSFLLLAVAAEPDATVSPTIALQNVTGDCTNLNDDASFHKKTLEAFQSKKCKNNADELSKKVADMRERYKLVRIDIFDVHYNLEKVERIFGSVVHNMERFVDYHALFQLWIMRIKALHLRFSFGNISCRCI